MIVTSEQSHQHSLETLNLLYEHDDFMESIGTLVDLGCGYGHDLKWWATRTTREDTPRPLKIRCTGVDTNINYIDRLKMSNVSYQNVSFENGVTTYKDKKFDLLWCHNSFQYALDPIGTLTHWRDIAEDNAMLTIIVPQTMNMGIRSFEAYQENGSYYHYSLVNLIHMLAVTGWDCHNGFFLKRKGDPWLHAVAYKSPIAPMDPRTTTWYELSDKKLIPASAEASVQKHGYLKQQDLVLPWLDKSLMVYNQQ